MTTLRLVLIRHAKAEVGDNDLDRGLTPRGRRDAAAVGAFLARTGIELDQVVVSPALRARQTWEYAQAELPGAVPTSSDERIYDNSVQALLDVIHDTADGVRTVALVGHNPSFAALAGALDNPDDSGGDAGARAGLRIGFPTAAVAVFVLTGQWSDLRPGAATVVSFDVPRRDLDS